MKLLIHTIMPAILVTCIIAIMFKVYLHFKYLRSLKILPKDLSFWEFKMALMKYLGEQMLVYLPVFFKCEYDSLKPNEIEEAKKMEKYIKICLALFYIGMAMMPIGIKLQDIC